MYRIERLTKRAVPLFMKHSPENALAVLRAEERPWGCLAHLFAWLPVWGFLINALLWLYFKNRSRQMVFHTQQSIQFQIYVLIPMVGWIVLSMIIKLLGTLDLGTYTLLHQINNGLLAAFFMLAAGISLVGATLTYLGKPFFYPVFGRRVLSGFIQKIQEG